MSSPIEKAICEALKEIAEGHASFCFAPDSAVFSGHFPGKPVLPGVVQVLMVVNILARQGYPSTLAHIKQAKFLAPVGPNMPLDLDVDTAKLPTVYATLRSPMGVAAKMQLVLA